MNFKQFRFLVPLAAVVATLGASAMAADTGSAQQYCDPLGGCPYVSVSPSTVKAGHATAVSGYVASGCKKPGPVTIYSRAFKGATRRLFAGVPAFFITSNRAGKFTKRVTIKSTTKAASYRVAGRCGGGNFGSTTLKVKR
jgi:hypothetical protein